MTKEEHKKLGITFFNKAWDYIDNANRTKEEDLEMLHYVHASRLHWELSGAPTLNLVRGDWQVAKVHVILGLKDSAMLYAKSCHDQTIENNFGDFDLVFAHEIMANAYKLFNDFDNMEKHLKLGYEAIDQVEKQGDKDYCKTELDKVKS